jgi:hypothetical protein
MHALEFPAGAANLMLPGPAGPLEVAVEVPGEEARALVAIVSHPLPTEGGTMHNKVVTMTARALRECGATTIRFNFRGVGESAGTFDEGEGEIADLRAVVDWVRAARPDDSLWLAGFSFGAYVSLRVAPDARPDLLLSIAPPVGRSWDFDQVVHPACPWLVIQGEADEIVDAQAVVAWANAQKPPPDLVLMPETSHFFHRRLMDLRGAIKSAVRPYLPAPPAA